MPAVVQRQKADSYKRVFMWLYSCSDEESLIEVDWRAIHQDTGLSRRTIFRALAFLKRVNLLKVKIARTGRGRHPLFWLNWRKFVKKSASLSREHNSKNHIHDGRRPSSTTWNKKLKAFRELLNHSWLLPNERTLCVSLIGRHLKARSTNYARQLYDALARIIRKIDAPNWVLTIQDLCRWWMGLIKGLMSRQAVMESGIVNPCNTD